LQNRKNLHREDAKDAKKRRRKREEKPIFLRKNSILPLAFVFLCVLRVFAVQGFPFCNTLVVKFIHIRGPLMQIYPPGTSIGPYEIASRPMIGGMGVVYICLDHTNDRPVALKTFKPEFLPDRAARDRFLREGTAWVELGRHPHIVRCYEVQYIDPTAYLALELIAKEQGMEDASLRSWLGQPMPLQQALLFALQIARGLEYANAKIPGFVHRDLKPENVLVGADKLPGTTVNRLRVTDFGLAKILEEDNVSPGSESPAPSANPRSTQLTQGVAGTPLYMAPEQWRGETLGAYTDIYALGCILYEMLTGRFAANGDSIAQLQAAHCTGSLRPLPTDLPRTLRDLLSRALALRPAERYPTWAEMIHALESAYLALGAGPLPEVEAQQAESPEERQQAGWSYNAMGLAYLHMGKAEVAAGYFENTLRLTRETGDRQGEGAALGNLGLAYADMGDACRAISYYEQCLAIDREIGDRRGEGAVLNNTGEAYRNLGDARRAIRYYEQGLVIAREIGDRLGEGNALGNLGIAYLNLGDARRAIGYYEQALVIDHEIGNQRGVGAVLGNMGNAYAVLGDACRAIEYYEQQIEIAREIGDRLEEGNALGNLGSAHMVLGDTHRAIEYIKQYLTIAREIGDQRGEGNALGNLGSAHATLGDAHRAISYYEQQLVIAREIGDRHGEGAALGNLGTAYKNLGDARRAILCYEQRMVIAREIGDLNGIAHASFNMARLYSQQNDPARALPLAQEAAQAFARIGHTEFTRRAQELVAKLGGGEVPPPPDPVQAAFEAFRRAGSPQAMQAAVAQHPLLQDARLIQVIEQAIAEQVPPEQKPAFEQRLAWLKQVTGG
jgi:serine/threonine protein kinase